MTLLESLVIVVRVELTWGTNPTIIILSRLADTNRLSYCPRSVHTHFQGLCVVFGLLISIPSARLTEQCCSHLLWLCESAESDLITSVVRGRGLLTNGDPCGVCRFPLTLILYHTFGGLSRGFSKIFEKIF